jgi:hypothetical protein
MKYLKYFEGSDTLKPDEFDNRCLLDIKEIFNEFAEENDFYQFEWTLDSHPLEVGVLYTYFTWEELEKQTDPNKDKLAIKISNDMLSQKYFNIQVNINEEMDRKKEYGGSKCSSRWDEIIQKINEEFIKRIEPIGYKVKISNGSSSSLDIWTDTIQLKIDYSEL